MIKKIYIGIWTVQILSTLLGITGMLVDSLVVGRFLGNQSIAAYGLVSPVLLLFTSVSGAIAVGAQNHAGEALGRGDKQRANQSYMSALALTVSAAILCAVVFIVFAEDISSLLGGEDDPGLLSDMVAYLRGYIIGIPGIAFLMISLPFVQLDGDRKSPVIVAVIKTFADILIDLLVVLVFKEGLFYVGLGSAISVYLADAYIMLHFLNSENMFHFRISDIKTSEFGEILKNGLPNGLSVALWTCMMLIMNRLALNNGGVTSVAALTITMSVYNFLVVNGTANSNTVAMLSATSAAELDYDALREIFRLGLKLSFLGNLLVGVPVFIFAGPIASLYTNGNAAVLACAITGIRFICIRIINCPCSILRNMFLGMMRLRLTRIMTVCSSFVTLALPAILFAALWGMNGVWLSFVTADIFVMIGLYVAFSLRKGHVIPKLEDYLSLNDSGAPMAAGCSFEIHSIEDVISASEQVGKMCKDYGEDLKTRLHAALAIEEHGVNVITHGYNGHMDKNSFFTIRVFYKNDALTISMKDSAKAFDPVKYMIPFENKTTADNIGLKLLTQNAKHIKYTYTFGYNCILVEV